MEVFRKNFLARPEHISAAVRANRNRELDGVSSLEQAGLRSTRAYIVKQVPLGKAKSAMYLAYGMAEVFDLMEAGKWKLAEAQLALLLVAVEQSALEDWRWPVAWSLTHLPEPPFHMMVQDPRVYSGRPMSRLADPSWLATALAMAKDIAVIQEARAYRKDPKKAKGSGKGANDGAAEEA